MSTHSLLVQTVLHVLPADGKAVNRAVILSVPLEAVYHNYYEGNKYVWALRWRKNWVFQPDHTVMGYWCDTDHCLAVTLAGLWLPVEMIEDQAFLIAVYFQVLFSGMWGADEKGWQWSHLDSAHDRDRQCPGLQVLTHTVHCQVPWS